MRIICCQLSCWLIRTDSSPSKTQQTSELHMTQLWPFPGRLWQVLQHWLNLGQRQAGQAVPDCMHHAYPVPHCNVLQCKAGDPQCACHDVLPPRLPQGWMPLRALGKLHLQSVSTVIPRPSLIARAVLAPFNAYKLARTALLHSSPAFHI